MKCTTTCNIFYDKYQGEKFCFQHGTIEFSALTGDAVEESIAQHAGEIPYSDKFIYTAVTKGCLTISELARELGIVESCITHATLRHAKKVNEVG